MWLRSKLGVENIQRCMWEFQEPLSTSGSTCAAIGGRVPGFWSRYAMEHVCLVGFIRRRLNVHRSDRERHKLLGLKHLDTGVIHGGCKMPWSLDPIDKHLWLLMVVCTWEFSLLTRDVCLMPRTKFDSNTMLNNIIISNAMCYTMLCMLEWMRKINHRIGTPRIRGLRGSALTAYIHKWIH